MPVILSTRRRALSTWRPDARTPREGVETARPLRIDERPASRGASLTTRGMAQLGLPELELGPLPLAHLAAGRRLLNRIAEELHELLVAAEGGPIRLEALRLPPLREGDRPVDVGLGRRPDSPSIHLHPVGRPTADPTALVRAAAARVLPPSDIVLTEPVVEADEAELAAVRERFVSGLSPGARLYLRVGTRGPRGVRSVWVEVIRWDARQVRGRVCPRSGGRAAWGRSVCCDARDVLAWRIA